MEGWRFNTILIGCCDIGTSCQKSLHHILVTFRAWCRPVQNGCLDVCPSCQQYFHHSKVSPLGGNPQGRFAITSGGLNAGSSCQKCLHHRLMSLLGGAQQGVTPPLLAASMLAPAASSLSTTSKWPFWHAMSNGVAPSFIGEWTDANSLSTTSSRPKKMAACNPVHLRRHLPHKVLLREAQRPRSSCWPGSSCSSLLGSKEILSDVAGIDQPFNGI